MGYRGVENSRVFKVWGIAVINASLRRDPEGEYKPEFVKRVLAVSKKDSGPFYVFTGKESFRRLLRSVK